jgi:trk system potassium uptake protein TrkA
MRVLICGGGQVGALTARRLVREGNEVTIVDPDPERCAELDSTLDAHVVEGSASRVLTLQKAGIRDAEMVIAVTDQDEVNILACLIAQVESKARVKVARIRTHEVDEWRRVTEASGVKIDLIIHPEQDLARKIMRVIRLPGVSDIHEFADGRIRLFGMSVERGSRLAGRTLVQLQEDGPPENSLVALIFRGSQVIVPHGAVRRVHGARANDQARAGVHPGREAARNHLRGAARGEGHQREALREGHEALRPDRRDPRQDGGPPR